MTYLTGKGIIDDVLTIIKNNSNPVRTKMLVWLNVVAQKLATDRAWQFLNNGTATLTPTSNVITLPADYGQIINIRSGADFFLTQEDKLSEEDAWRLDNAEPGALVPRGYTESVKDTIVSDVITARVNTIKLYGADVTGSVVVKYIIEPQPILDTVGLTCWPVQCRSLFMRSCLDFFYEYDLDERSALSYQLNESELYVVKKWDNTQKPKPKPNRHGYIRGR